MKRSIKMLAVTGAAVAILATGDSSQAATVVPTNWYAGISGDLTWLRNSDTGGGGNVDIGYRFDDFRIEGEAGYHGAGGQSGFGSTHYFTWMGNVYYDFNRIFPSSGSGWHVAPYVGGGLGDAQVHFGS